MGKFSIFLSLLAFSMVGALIAKQVLQRGDRGSIVHYPAFSSNFVEPRPIEVWLPEGYNPSSTERYPVIYMHDGQFLFTKSKSWLVWTPWLWKVDVAISDLIRAKKIRPAIVVAPWNLPGAKRSNEYMPQKPVIEKHDSMLIAEGSDIRRTDINSDNYLRFLVEELKPFIDANYHTLPERASTFTMGSSMGGMVSAYAISEYPDIFGAAACLSTHWNIADGAVIEWYQDHWPDAGHHRLYFDFGTESFDAHYEPYQNLMDGIIRSKGYQQDDDWITRKYPGADHSPKAWRERLHIPLGFLLGPTD